MDVGTQRDTTKYHYPPDHPTHIAVNACTVRTKHKQVRPFVQIVCPEHPFTFVSECTWSRRMGIGWPADEGQVNLFTYWRRMARINKRTPWKPLKRRKRGTPYRVTPTPVPVPQVAFQPPEEAS